jgi:hypothetical protein
MFALEAYGKAMTMLPDANPEAVRREVFGLLGYKDGSRFFSNGPPPAVAQMQQQMQQMQQEMQKVMQELAKAQLQLADKSQENEIKAFDAETKRLQASKPEQVDMPDPIAQMKGLADIDLTQAQTVKTLVDAAIAPEQAMAKQAASTEQ